MKPPSVRRCAEPVNDIETPTVKIYCARPVGGFLAKPHLATYIAQPNVIAGKEIVPEFLLPFRGGQKVAVAAQHLLDSESARETQRQEFRSIAERLLSGPRLSEAAADVALEMIARQPK